MIVGKTVIDKRRGYGVEISITTKTFQTLINKDDVSLPTILYGIS